MTSRFIAGGVLSDAFRVVEKLAGEHIAATLDFLGENVTSLTEAARSRESYLQALGEVEQTRLPATISVKLTQLGLDFSTDACLANVSALVARAQAMNTMIEIDMEGSEYTDRTLQIVKCLHERFQGHVRAVVQAYLYRSEADIERLSDRRIPVRLCKGAYHEPAEIAFQHKRDVDRNYLKLLRALLEAGTYPAIATHDVNMIRAAVKQVKEQNVAADRFEFQMLYGVGRDLQRELVRRAYRLRLYIPYGDAWYPYFMRRLAERPANLLFLVRNLIR
ncbi:MAG: proline dehydrogenase family protein [Acidobacteriaceae bacterium]|nr:proline dehydrogenase family protein [Acidobacteriaceae bacterium]